MRGMMRLGMVLGVALMASVAWAIDLPSSAVSRIEILVPGLSVQLIESCGPVSTNPGLLCTSIPLDENMVRNISGPPVSLGADGGGYTHPMDALGNVYDHFDIHGFDCGVWGGVHSGLGRVRQDLSYEKVLQIAAECDGSSVVESPLSEGTRLWNLDSVSGTAFLTVVSRRADGTTHSLLLEVFRVSGLPTLFDVVATFEPSARTLSWNVPPMPEAFPEPADTFDVLAGDLAALPNLTQSTRVACDTSGPIPGDRISITDPLNDPQIGNGIYYLVATQRGQEERIGRQRIGGELSGRPVMGLSGCP